MATRTSRSLGLGARRRPSAVVLALGWVGLLLASLAQPAAASVSYADFSLPVNDFPQGITAGDCNDDGIPDLLVSDQGSDDVTILRNIGNGGAFLTSVAIAA
jgi:hypothetical protein